MTVQGVLMSLGDLSAQRSIETSSYFSDSVPNLQSSSSALAPANEESADQGETTKDAGIGRGFWHRSGGH